MLTMFGWDWPRKEASFWMPRDVMRKMKAEGNFICWLWRTDIWDPQCPPEIVDRNIKEGSSWTEFVKAGGSSRA